METHMNVLKYLLQAVFLRRQKEEKKFPGRFYYK